MPKRSRDDTPLESSFKRYPSLKVQELRKKQKKLNTGSCVEHPVQKNKYMVFTPDPDTVRSNEVVLKYTLKSVADAGEQNKQLSAVPPAVYNYILFANQDTQQFILHLMRMNPMEYYSKHMQILADASHIDDDASFVYSGEMKFDGSRAIVASDMSSLYFLNLKSDSIVFAMKQLLPNMDEHIGNRGRLPFENYLATFSPGKSGHDAFRHMLDEFKNNKKAEMMFYMKFYNNEGYLEDGKRQEIDLFIETLFVKYLSLALSTIFGSVAIQYNKEIFALSDQRFLTREFMDAICRVKEAAKYPPLFSDDGCQTALDETWCSYYIS